MSDRHFLVRTALLTLCVPVQESTTDSIQVNKAFSKYVGYLTLKRSIIC